MPASDLTTSSLLAAATDVLTGGGYVKRKEALSGWPASSRLFEDQYGVVAIVVHETWKSLVGSWQDDQGRFVELLAETVNRSDPKAWEGYLVLLTPSAPAGATERHEAQDVRYDISRVRKLVATGHELKTISDVSRALLSLLPLPEPEAGHHEASILASLPPLLEEEGIPSEMTNRLIEAFERQTSLLGALEPEGTEE